MSDETEVKKPYDQMTMAEVQEALAAPTPPDEIEWIHQFGSVWDQHGIGWTALALATADARFFQDRLDEVCGAFNWQSDIKFIGGILLVGIGIRSPDRWEEWLWKWDTGQEQKTHTDMSGGAKSVFSRGLKRAGYQWGIGRDLYEYPKPRVKCKTYKRKSDNKDMFSEFVENVWEVLEVEGRGESPETGRVHKSRVDEIGSIIATPTTFYDIALGKLKYEREQAHEIANLHVDEKTTVTDWDGAIKQIEEGLLLEERLYTAQEKRLAKIAAEKVKEDAQSDSDEAGMR